MTQYEIDIQNRNMKLIATILTISLAVFVSLSHFKLQSVGMHNPTLLMQLLTLFTVLGFSFIPVFVVHVRPVWFLLLPVALWDGVSIYFTFKYTSGDTLVGLIAVKSWLYGAGAVLLILIVGYLINYINLSMKKQMDTTTEDRHRTEMDKAKKEAEKTLQEKILEYEKLSEKHAAQQKSLTVDYNNRISDLQNAVAIGVYYSIKYFATFKENISAKEINNKMPNPKAQDRIKFDFITSEYINIINTYCAKAFSPISSNIIHNS